MIRVQLERLAKLSARRLHVAFQSQSEPEIVVIFGIGGIQLNCLLQILHRGREVSPIRHDLAQGEINCGLFRG